MTTIRPMAASPSSEEGIRFNPRCRTWAWLNGTFGLVRQVQITSQEADNGPETASGTTGSGGTSSEGTGSRVTEHSLLRRRFTPGRRALRWSVAAALLAWVIYEGVNCYPALFGLVGFVLLVMVVVLVVGSTYSRIRLHDGQFPRTPCSVLS